MNVKNKTNRQLAKRALECLEELVSTRGNGRQLEDARWAVSCFHADMVSRDKLESLRNK